MIKGCTTSTACNYNPDAKEADNSCIDPLGCDNWCPGDTTEVKELDCADVCGGIAFIDCSDQCGILITDDCGVCGGNNAICTDCNGVVNGDAFIDPHYNIGDCKTNECVGGNTGLEACNYGCDGDWGSDAQLDACGVCEGTSIDDSQCTECPSDQTLGCDNSCYLSGTQPLNDECNVCGGDNTVCADCFGVLNGNSELDVCGVCGGDDICHPEDCTDGNESGYCQDLSVLQNFIDNSSGTINMDMDENGNGVIEPSELGEQTWTLGRLTELSCFEKGSDWYWCDLSGNIPESIGTLMNLTILRLMGNQLTGSIPPEIGNLINLNYLALSSNEFTGEIPSEIGSLVNLSYLSLSDNEFTGEIPTEIGSLINLSFLTLSDNEFTGEIPIEICNLFFQPTYLAINNNNLCPPYPECIENYVGEQDLSSCEIVIYSSIDNFDVVPMDAGLILQFAFNWDEDWFEADTIIKEIINLDNIIIPSTVWEIQNSQSWLINSEPLSFWYDPSTNAFAFIQNTTHIDPGGTGEGLILLSNAYNTISFQPPEGDISALVFQSDVDVDGINVVPNPFIPHEYNESPYNNSVRFTHLPEQCNITIFSIDGDTINTLTHNSQFDDTELEWDLSNIQGEQINPGIYEFHVESNNSTFRNGVLVYP